MACDCVKFRESEYDRARDLAKASALAEQQLYVIYTNNNEFYFGSYEQWKLTRDGELREFISI